MALGLNDKSNEIPLVGPVYAKKLEELGIVKVKDFLYHFPFRYEDTRNITAIGEIDNAKDEIVTIKGTVVKIKGFYTRSRKFIVQAEIKDDTGILNVIWFNQRFLLNTVKEGCVILASGKLQQTEKGAVLLYSPNYEVVYKEGEYRHLGIISPIYPLTTGITQKWLRGRIKYVIDNIGTLKETLPKSIIDEYKLERFTVAIQNIHFPTELDQIEKDTYRLAFQELFEIMLKIVKRKHNLNNKPGILITIDKKLHENIIKSLPFKLTASQLDSIHEIYDDISGSCHMDRLLSGDVGSGKTIVAIAAMLQVVQAGYKALIMTPTTILANQHFDTFNTFLGREIKQQIKMSRLIGNPHGKELKEAQASNIVIGTQSLLHHQELFSKTGLIVVDEQHRFGVEQRDQLVKNLNKLSLKIQPHILTMTATPIPRTLALVFFGDQDLSMLTQMPAGRKQVKTAILTNKKREQCYIWITEQILKRNQGVYIVCPLIEESDKLQLKAVKEELKIVSCHFKGIKVEMLHGKLKNNEKQEILIRFKKGTTKILVTTPVIEVGIDIPEANIMIIEGAERFGLAQLHQLRGRIGRGKDQGFCFVALTSYTKDQVDRVKYFCQTVNGFKLAQYDLKRRGPGEVYGLKQSGIPNLKIASFSNIELVKVAKLAAEKYLSEKYNEK
jgi:ATP-dependent DNA helicase RecG